MFKESIFVGLSQSSVMVFLRTIFVFNEAKERVHQSDEESLIMLTGLRIFTSESKAQGPT